jgi:hypothetical protein
MALPDPYGGALRKTRYLSELRNDVNSHQRRITQLQEEIRLAEEEIRLHDVVLELAHNRQLIEAVVDLSDDSGLKSTFATDPLRYCGDAGIALPEGVTLRPVDTKHPSPRLTARVQRGAWDMEIVWERDVGFFVRPYLGPTATSEA